MKFAKNITQHRVVPHGGPHSIKGLGSQVLDFSSNVNPLGCPKPVFKALASTAKRIPQYPDSESLGLKEALAKYIRCRAENLVVGNGATEIIYNYCRALVDKTTKVLIQAPTFGEYEAAAMLSGGRPVFFQDHAFGGGCG